MQDFNSFVNDEKQKQQNFGDMDKNLYDLVGSLASRFDGKSQQELIKAIYEEAKKGKQNGTLSNAQIDDFVSKLSPLLDDKKRKMLVNIANELKKI